MRKKCSEMCWYGFWSYVVIPEFRVRFYNGCRKEKIVLFVIRFFSFFPRLWDVEDFWYFFMRKMTEMKQNRRISLEEWNEFNYVYHGNVEKTEEKPVSWVLYSLFVSIRSLSWRFHSFSSFNWCQSLSFSSLSSVVSFLVLRLSSQPVTWNISFSCCSKNTTS